MKLTKYIGSISQISPIGLMVLVCLFFASCTEEEGGTSDTIAPLTIASFGGSKLQDEADTRGANVLTRAYTDADLFVPGTPSGGEKPSGVPNYLPYNKLYPSQINKTYTTIGVFLAQNGMDSYETLSGYFQWKEGNKWDTTVGVKPVQYYIFGYMPSNVGNVSAKIEKLTDHTSWEDGATMTIKNLSTVTPADVCVVVGVKKAPVGFDPEHPWGIDDATNVVPVLQQGQYTFTGTETDNYVYLLLDHLYTNVNMELCVDPDYARLRTIVLKEVYMKTPVRNTVDATITLSNDPKSPIQNLSFTTPTGDTPTNAQIFPNDPEYARAVAVKGVGVTSIPGYFAPGMTTQSFDFEFHYDVYDKSHPDDPENYPYGGNCVRQNCIAINKWTLPGDGVRNGKSYKVSATIVPTYLYMLSEPDLDNPTIELDRTPAPAP